MTRQFRTVSNRPRLAPLLAILAACSALLATPPPCAAQRGQIAPEAATGRTEHQLVTTRRSMVVAANPLAVEAGISILDAGGSAADAAIAVQLVLGLVEPQSSGLGGGAFLLHWAAERGQLETYDGRETAPAAARPDRFMRDGRPMPFPEAVASGLSVGTPGVARLMERLHADHGRLPWPRLFEPAIRLASDGFVVSSRLASLVAGTGPAGFSSKARAYFFPDGSTPIAAGAVLRQPQYADTLRRLAADGAVALHRGPIAAEIVDAVQGAERKGDLTTNDLAEYRVVKRDAVCTTYRSHRVCGMGPPSSGGIAVAQTLRLLEPFDLGATPGQAMNAQALHLIAEAQKLAYADRDRYLADPDFVSPPAGLLDAAYIASRQRLIGPRAMPRPQAGEPPSTRSQSFGDDSTVEAAGTSHISIVDAAGNAVSMTTTIEGAFGSRLMAAGFLLNNQLTDFAFRPADAAGRPAANRVEPLKRPRSSMAPTMVFDDRGRLVAVLGSPGGARIILYVVKTLVALIDWKLDAQTAVALANFGSRGGAFEIEFPGGISDGGSAALTWQAMNLAGRGHTLAPDEMTSGLHLIVVRGDRLEGGADPRREGTAAGR